MRQDTASTTAHVKPLEQPSRDFARSSTLPEPRMAPNQHHTADEHSDDEDASSLDISAFVAMLAKVEAANSEDPSHARAQAPREASRKEGYSQGSLRPVEKPQPESWSSSSAPVPGSNTNTTSSPNNRQQDPAGTVSWRDIEQYSLKLDADGSGVRIEGIDLSCVEAEDPKSLALSPKTLAELKALESTDSAAASPTNHTHTPPAALAYPPAYQPSSYPKAPTRVSMTSAPPHFMPMGGDIVGAATRPLPFYNPPSQQPSISQAALVSQASGRWLAETQQLKAEIQPMPRQTTPTAVTAKQIPLEDSRGAVEKEQQRDIDMEFHELNSRPTRSSSMVVPGATALRRAPAKPAGTKGFLGSIKSKCGDLFSSSKRSKGRD